MRKSFEREGVIRSFEVNNGRVCTTIYINGRWVSNPILGQFLAQGWAEYIAPEPTPYTPTYEERVVALIRERYTIDEELAIQRQRESKPTEFAEYNAFCEDCKRIAKEG